TLGLLPSTIPELPVAKTTDQKGVVKVAVCAYHQKTGEAYWQSGAFPVVATAKDSWLLGVGPWQRGSIYTGAHFAGNKLLNADEASLAHGGKRRIPVTAEAIFTAAAAKDGDEELTDKSVSTTTVDDDSPESASPPAPTKRTPTAKILRLPAVDKRDLGLA